MKNQIRIDQKIDIIIGAPGTGKSTYMKQEINEKKSYAEKTGKVYRLGYEYIIIAPTGQAAKNVNGRTIHSLIGFGRTDYNEFAVNGIITDELADYFKRNIKVTKLQDIYIDEVAAIDYNLIENLDRLLRNAMNNYRQAFGGVNIIATGDSMQIQPVNGKTALLYKDLVEKANIKVLKENKRFSGELLDVITDAQKNKYVNFKNIELTNPEDLFLCKHVIVDTNKKRYEYNFKSINYETKQYINIYFDEKEYKNSLENKNIKPEILAPNREIILKSNRAVNAINFEYNGDRAQLTSIGVYDFKENLESSEYEKRLFKSEKPFDIANKTKDVVVVFKYLHKCYVPEEDKEYEYNKCALYRAKIVDGTYVCVENLRKTPNAIGGFYEEKLGTPFIDSFAITAHIAQGSTITEKFGIDLSTKSAAPSSAYVALTRATSIDNIVFAKMSKSSRRIDKDMWAINDVLLKSDNKKLSRKEFIRMVNIIQEYAVEFDKENATDLAIQVYEATYWSTTDYINERLLMAEVTRKMQLDDIFYEEKYCPIGRTLLKSPNEFDENGKYIGLPEHWSFADIKRKKYKTKHDGEIIAIKYRTTSTMVICRVRSAYEAKRKGNKNKYSSSADLYVEVLGFTVDVDDVFYDNPKRDIKKVLKKLELLPIQPNMITISGSNGMHLKFLLETPILLDKNIRGGYNKTGNNVINNEGFELADKIKRIIEYTCWYLPLSNELGSLGGGKQQNHQGVNQGTTITGSLTKKGKRATTFLLNSVPVLTPRVICNLMEKYGDDTKQRKECGTDVVKILNYKKNHPKEEFNRAETLELLYKEQDIAKVFEETPRDKLTGKDKDFKEACKRDTYEKYDFCMFVKSEVIRDKAVAVPNGSQEKQVVNGIKFFSDILITVPYSSSYRLGWKEALLAFGEVASGLAVPKNEFARELEQLVKLGLARDVVQEAIDGFGNNKSGTTAKCNASVNTYKRLLGSNLIKAYEEANKEKLNNKKQTLRNSNVANVNEVYSKVIEDIFNYKPSYNSPKYKNIYRELCSYGITTFEILEFITNTDYNLVKILAKDFASRGIVSKSMSNRYDRFFEAIIKAITFEDFRRDGINFMQNKRKENKPRKEMLFAIIENIIGEYDSKNLTPEIIKDKTEHFIAAFTAKQSSKIVGRLSFYINNNERRKVLDKLYSCIDWKTVNSDSRFKERVETSWSEKAGTDRGSITKAKLFTSDSDLERAYERLSIPGYTYADLSPQELKALKAPLLKNKAELNKLMKEDPKNYSCVSILIEAIDNSLKTISEAQEQVSKMKTTQEIIDEIYNAKTRRDNIINDFLEMPEGITVLKKLRKIDASLTDLYKEFQTAEMNFDKEALNNKDLLRSLSSEEKYIEYKQEKLANLNTEINKKMYDILSNNTELYDKARELLEVINYTVDTSKENNDSVYKTFNTWTKFRKAIFSHTSKKVKIKTDDLRVEKNHQVWYDTQQQGYGKKVKQIFEEMKQEKLDIERVVLEHAQKLEEKAKNQE